MPEAEFDQFAPDYQQQHAASIRMSGETPDFFARYKIEDIATTLMAAGRRPNRILDFGAGIGNSLGPMRAIFPDAEIVLLDPSAQSLDMAAERFPGQAHFTPFDGETIPFPGDGSMSSSPPASFTISPSSCKPDYSARSRGSSLPAAAFSCSNTTLSTR